jgi:hypothetical protein
VVALAARVRERLDPRSREEASMTAPPAPRAPPDPTTAAMTAQIVERDQFRIENVRLGQALVTALTEIEALKTERAQLAANAEHALVKGYDQAVHEIRDHFAKVHNGYIVAVIEEIWLKKKERS